MTWLQAVIVVEWLLIPIGALIFLALYGRPWKYVDRVMSWHLVAVTAVAGLEAIGLLVAEHSLHLVAVVYGAATAVVWWRLWLLIQMRRRARRRRES